MHWEVEYDDREGSIRHVTIDQPSAIALACRLIRGGWVVRAVRPMLGEGAVSGVELARLCGEFGRAD